MAKTSLIAEPEKEIGNPIEKLISEENAESSEVTFDQKVALSIYMLRKRSSMGLIKDMHFVAGSREEAIKIARAYCEKFGHRFVFVEPFCTDLRIAKE